MLEYLNLNWSVWGYEEACSSDRFFMVRCGEGKTGICMSGYFASDPYKGEDCMESHCLVLRPLQHYMFNLKTITNNN